MSENLHYVTVKPQSAEDGTELTPTVKFQCKGDDTAACHIYPDCSCESWDDDHAHETAHHQECWMQAWFDNECHSYEGDDTDDWGDWGIPAGMDRSGEVKVSFCEEYVEWEFVS